MVNNPGDRLWARFSELVTALERFVDLIEILKATTNEMTTFEFVEEWSSQRILELCQIARVLEDEARGFQNQVREFRAYLNHPNFDAAEIESEIDQINIGITKLASHCTFLRTICEQERVTIVEQRFTQFLRLIVQLNELRDLLIFACQTARPSIEADAIRRLINHIADRHTHYQEVARSFANVIPEVPLTLEATRQLYERLREEIFRIRTYINQILDVLEGINGLE